MRIFHFCFLLIALLTAPAACRTAETREEPPVEAEESGGPRQELEQIRSAYAPPACYLANFTVTGRLPGQGERSARGTIRADNENDRMVLEFRDPFLGITISRVVIRDGFAFVRSAEQGTLAPIPLNQFYVQGLGNNGIQLPFVAFQDLLYARLPAALFEPGARLQQEQSRLEVLIGNTAQSYRYEFEERRLRTLKYASANPPANIDVTLEGAYRDSQFPESINMQAGPGSQSGELLRLDFRSVDQNASCAEYLFARP